MPFLVALVSCFSDASSERARAPYIETDSMGARPTRYASVPILARRELTENSGITMSLTQPGVLFAINDSGHEAILYSFDTTGVDRGAWRLIGARNTDWEALSSGPCAASGATAAVSDSLSAGGVASGERCLYIGDVGDNSAERRTRRIYRVREPTVREAGYVGELAADSVTYRYADGPRDVEGMYVGPDATLYLIGKRPRGDGSQRLRPALVYVLEPTAWSGFSTMVAQLQDSLAIVPGSVIGRLITDAALSADARYVAVRTYSQVYVFAADPATGRIRTSVPPAICNVVDLNEPQGEGVTWYANTQRLLLTTEGAGVPFHVIGCPLPPA